MFDWNDQDQVGDTIWGEFNENEDHIVPYTKDIEASTLFTFREYNKKQKNEDANSVARSPEQISGAKDEVPRSNVENNSSLNTDEELSDPRPDMDTWPDLPALNVGFSRVYNNENNHDSLETALMNDLNEASNLNNIKVQLDGEPGLLGNEHEDNGSDSFLDCDWANIGDFDDLDRIFRNNESIFGHEMVANVGEFLSPSIDVIDSTARSIPMPEIPLSRDQPSDQDCASFQLVEHSDGKAKPGEKTADSTVETREQSLNQAHVTGEYCGIHNQFLGKEDRPKKLLKSQKKAEERSKNKALQNVNGAWLPSITQSQQYPGPKAHPPVSTSLQTFQFPACNQLKQVGDVESKGHAGCSNQLVFSGYGYPTYPMYPLPAIPLQSHIQRERNQTKNVAVGHKFHPDPLKHSNGSNKVLDVESRPSKMTPQEKIEKLRRRQQMQAMLAIQQQQQKLGHHITGTDNLVSQASSQKNQSQDAVTSNTSGEESANKLPLSDFNILGEYDESKRISTSIDDNSLEETVYHQLQDVLEKLDTRVRLCIWDSLFRLARSAMERQSASDRSCTNKSAKDEDEVPINEETNIMESGRRLPDADAETYTNPIDRTVAHLLFHRPLESGAIPLKDEMPQSPSSCYPDKVPLNVPGSISQEQQESFGEMVAQPPP